MRPRDTSPEAWKVLTGLIEQMTPDERMERTFQLSAFVRAFVEAEIRSRHPNATEREIFLLCAKRRLGPELFEKVYPNELTLD